MQTGGFFVMDWLLAFFAGIGIWSSALRAAGLLNVMSAAA